MSDLPPLNAEPIRPSVDDILGKPTPDALLGPPPVNTNEVALGGLGMDDYFSQGSVGAILDTFGQGFKQGWGTQPLGITPKTEEWMRKAGLWNDYEAGQRSFIKAMNEAAMRPAATAIDLGERALKGVLGGTEALAPAPYEVASLALESSMGVLGVHIPIPHLPPQLATARSLRVIGEGEAGWKGTVEATPDAAVAQADAAKAALPEIQAEQQQSIAVSSPVPPEPVAPPDIHAIARRLAPDTFQEYDALDAQRAALSRRIDDLKGGEELTVLDDRIDSLRGARLEAPRQDRARLANEITELENQRADLADKLRSGEDTAETARLRQQRQQLDFRMRDLATQVSEAYRQARELSPEEIPLQPIAAAPEPAAPVEQPAPVATEPVMPPAAPRPVVPDIAADVRQKLVEAGRPAEEANAASQIVDAYYRTRAERFNGALGTPEELYAAEGPEIARGRGAARAGAAGRTILKDGQTTIELFGKADASTFIHETGHQWLADLMQDADHEQATSQLKADAQAVRGWLGAEPDADITPRQHEKFARGFERYMMEGRAPSEALASVFAQFKEWLTSIYQTVSRLRAPITDDIRQVFDRMLATPERPSTITPERETPQTIADTHEALVGRTPAEQAGPVADQVRAEIIAEAGKIPEVQNELGRGPAGGGAEAGGSPTTGEPIDRNATPAGAVPGYAPTPEPTGAVIPRGGAPTPEGARVSPEPTGANAATITAERPGRRPTPEPTTPNEPFGTAESTLLDKAGNIRLENLNAPEDVNEVLREVAAENEDFITARRGVLSDAEVLDLADALGMRAADLDARKIGQAFNAEEIIAARKLLVRSATAVRDAAAKIADAINPTEADILAYAEVRARHRMVQEQVSGVTAEAGRALRAFRAIEGMQDAETVGRFLDEATEGLTLYQLRREARALYQLKTPQQASKFLADAKKGVFDWVQSYFVNALISGPATHGEYMIGNTLFAIYKATAETAMSAAFGAGRRALGGAAEGVHLGEVPAQIYGMFRGYRNGWQAAWDAFKANETFALPGEKLRAQTPFTKVIPNPEIAGVQIPIGDVLEVPSRGVTALHAFSRTVGYSRSISGQAYRIAASEGLEGIALAQRISDLTTSPTEAMMTEAIAEANEDAMMQHAKFGSFTQKIAAITNAGIAMPDIPLPGGVAIPLGTLRPIKFIDPFVTIASNIINATLVRRTPLGLLSEQMRADLSGLNGGVAMDKAAGRMLAGTTLMLTAGGLAAEELITGSGPSDPRERAVRMMTGWQPHSVKIGEIYYDIKRLGVLGMQMGIAADLYEAGHLMATEDGTKVAHLLTHAVSQNILDESFMRGPSELIRALEEPDRYGQRFIQQFLSSFLPFSVGEYQIARTIDPYSRQARTLMDAFQQKIPWLSEALLPRRDLWGEPIPNKEALVPGLTAIYQSRINNDPVNQALLRLGVFPAQPERKVRGVELTDQQYDDLSRTAGRMAKMRLDQIVANPGFTQMPEFAQREIMTKTISQMREAARTMLMMQPENHDIIDTANAAKKAQVQGKTPEQVRRILKQQPSATIH